MKTYAVCTSPRSGSTWFCDLLTQVALGDPWECLNPEPEFCEWRANVGARREVPQDAAGFDALCVAVSRHGICGVKLFADHPYVPEFLEHVKPKCIRLRRRDTVRQAISLYRAMSTAKWRSDQEAARDEPQYDHEKIRGQVEYLQNSEAAWDRLLPPNTPTLWYEDLVTDPLAALRVVAYMIDAPAPHVAPVSRFQIQRDSLTDEWAARYG